MCGTTWLLLSNTAVQNPAGVFTLFISFGFKTAATTLYQHLFLTRLRISHVSKGTTGFGTFDAFLAALVLTEIECTEHFAVPK